MLDCVHFLVTLSVSGTWLQITFCYNTVAEFNVNSKAECGQLNLAHVARKIYKNIKKQKLKQTKNATVHLVQCRFKICEGSPEGIRRLWRKGLFCEKDEF